mmetsp:Transcript_52545/g.78275  ORF Transcript_52545/g.78275 Transcript_52545/m.78275 type:complete len:93 (+) Transcript_52545:153-431(+)
MHVLFCSGISDSTEELIADRSYTSFALCEALGSEEGTTLNMTLGEVFGYKKGTTSGMTLGGRDDSALYEILDSEEGGKTVCCTGWKRQFCTR